MSAESLTPLRDQLEVLKAEEQAAGDRYQVASAALKNEWEISRDLLTPWTYSMQRNEELSSDELREHTDNLLAQIRERGLVLSLDPRSPGHRALVVIDPAVRTEASAATFAAGQARSARIAFEASNAAELAAEKSRAAAKKFAETVEAGEDIGAIREALEIS